MENVIVLGSGPAGLTAALYLARANLNPLVIAGNQPGGQLMITSEVENFPGFPLGIQGPELMSLMRQQVERFGARLVDKNATSVVFGNDENKKHKVVVDKDEYFTDSLVIATGASALWLNLPSEERLKGKGVSACATCDGFFFKNKKVAVVGGGDTALEEALFLTKFAQEVTLIHRRDSFRGSKIMQDRVLSHDKIKVKWNCVVDEILGESHVEGIVLKSVQSGEKETLPLDGVFIAIGHKPNTDIFMSSGLIIDKTGYVETEHEVWSNVEGVFIAGDVADHEFRQAVTAAGSGCKAAIAVERYLSSSPVTPSQW
jgi:thioredoxin reductase (NADPH)